MQTAGKINLTLLISFLWIIIIGWINSQYFRERGGADLPPVYRQIAHGFTYIAVYLAGYFAWKRTEVNLWVSYLWTFLYGGGLILILAGFLCYRKNPDYYKPLIVTISHFIMIMSSVIPFIVFYLLVKLENRP